jgi:hypothetical protein
LLNSNTESWLSATIRAMPSSIPAASCLTSAVASYSAVMPEYQFVAVAEHRDPGAQLQGDRGDRQQALHRLAHQPQLMARPGRVVRQRYEAALREPG